LGEEIGSIVEKLEIKLNSFNDGGK